MVFPLTKLNKEGTLLNASHSYYSEEYAQRMCSLYLTDELSRDETGKIKRTYRLHALPEVWQSSETDWETADIKYTWTL